jgi:hypothetical protein
MASASIATRVAVNQKRCVRFDTMTTAAMGAIDKSIDCLVRKASENSPAAITPARRESENLIRNAPPMNSARASISTRAMSNHAPVTRNSAANSPEATTAPKTLPDSRRTKA